MGGGRFLYEWYVVQRHCKNLYAHILKKKCFNNIPNLPLLLANVAYHSSQKRASFLHRQQLRLSSAKYAHGWQSLVQCYVSTAFSGRQTEPFTISYNTCTTRIFPCKSISERPTLQWFHLSACNTPPNADMYIYSLTAHLLLTLPWSPPYTTGHVRAFLEDRLFFFFFFFFFFLSLLLLVIVVVVARRIVISSDESIPASAVSSAISNYKSGLWNIFSQQAIPRYSV